MSQSIEDKVRVLVEAKIVDREDLFLVGVKMHPSGRLEVLVDGDQGIGIRECAEISRYVGFELEEADAVGHAYRLEVSSPGIDTPLASVRQYRKNIGRNVQVLLNESMAKEGELVEVTDEHIIIKEKIKEKGKKAVEHQSTIPFGSIKTTKVLISFK